MRRGKKFNRHFDEKHLQMLEKLAGRIRNQQEDVVNQHEPIRNLIPPRSQIGSPMRRKQILRPAVEGVPGLPAADITVWNHQRKASGDLVL